jgi:large subunit ribosomal protein L18
MKKKFTRQKKIRHIRLRRKIIGTADKPRLCVSRSLSNFSAQLIDDIAGKTLLSVSTFDKDTKTKIRYGGNTKAAEQLGKMLAEKSKNKGITKVVFDRGGSMFHGRIKAFADAMRKEGLAF